MRKPQFSSDALAALLYEQKIATLPELMTTLGTDARRTTFRKLAELDYRTSYSHRGRYYTLEELAEFDSLGLWAYDDVHFSRYGTLLATAARLIEIAEAGYFIDELDNLLHVATKDALRKLVSEARVAREALGGRSLYCAVDPKRRRQQLLERRARLAEPGAFAPLPEPSMMSDELRAAIVLFYSLLDEKLRRLYAGLEALKTGHGGDARIAELLGLDPATVARGRRELLDQDVETDGVRRGGAGRPWAEKKRRKSSPASRR